MTWKYCYKIKDGNQETTNLLYSPKKNIKGDTFCMTWDHNDPYQKDNKNLNQDLIDFFFNREINYLNVFKDSHWCPEVKEINNDSKQIYLEWNNETLNHIINDPNRNLDIECPDWRIQIFNILDDINKRGFYKLALYPHCFFINKDGIIKTIDFYSVIEKNYPFIERRFIEGMIGRDSTGRFDQATDRGVINFKIFFENTMLTHLGKTWITDNPFPEFYRRLIDD
jgi:hypothetical protein